MKSCLVVALLALTLAGCGPTPAPNLTPTVTQAQQVTAVLNVIQAAAMAANLQTPKLLSDANLKLVTNVITASEATIAQAPKGWQPTVLAALASLQAAIPEAEYASIAKYVVAAEVLIPLVASS